MAAQEHVEIISTQQKLFEILHPRFGGFVGKSIRLIFELDRIVRYRQFRSLVMLSQQFAKQQFSQSRRKSQTHLVFTDQPVDFLVLVVGYFVLAKRQAPAMIISIVSSDNPGAHCDHDHRQYGISRR